MEFDRWLFHLVVIFTSVFLLAVVVLGWAGKVKFGFGLGDLAYLISTIVGVILVAVFYIRSNRSIEGDLVTLYDKYLMIACILIVIIICLKLTVLRGPASPWNGTIFFH
jgi:hypothetical protein